MSKGPIRFWEHRLHPITGFYISKREMLPNEAKERYKAKRKLKQLKEE